MAIYRTTKALSKKGGIIPNGGRVSAAHPRFDEGIRNGWIVKDDNSAIESTPPVPSLSEEVETEPKPEPIMDPETVPESVSAESEEIEPEPEPETLSESSNEETGDESNDSLLISDIDFLGRVDESALLERGIMQISDLEGWTVGRLMTVRGIGSTKADQLMDMYDKWVNSKNSE